MSAAAPELDASGAHRAHGRYELGREIARGGMGVVFRAYDSLGRREVAYKRLLVQRESSRARGVALFEREYAALARLSHPNIVEVYDYGFDGETTFYTMELLVGRDLLEAAPLPMREACSVLRDVASALGLVHARRLVHRDISPANVRLTPKGRPKLIDFGAQCSFGAAPDVVGTPAFLAPECLTTRELDARTDLFSLGAVAYWLLTRRAPFLARSFEARLRDLTPEIAPPSTYVAALPQALEELVLSLLHPDPRVRPASAAEVMERLTAIADLPTDEGERQVAFSYLMHPPLVGRDAELEHARTLLKEAASGQVLSAAIEGLPGLGRTGLLDQIAIDAQLAGCTVLRAQGNAHGRAFGVGHALVRAALATYPRVEGPSSSVLPILASETNTGPAATPVDAAQRHARALAAMQACLVEVGQLSPLAILVDDAERADAESLALLASLAHSAQGCSILIVVAVTSEAAAVQNAALAKLLRTAARITLSPLRGDHMLELVASIFGAAPNAHRLARWLSENSQGSPAACMDLLRLLLHRDVVHYGAGTFSLPHDIPEDAASGYEAAARLARFERLHPLARVLAQVLSIQDVSMTLELLAAAAEFGGRELVLALEELRSAAVVRYSDKEIAFASETIRAAIQATLDEVARRALHLRIARALLARDERTPAVNLLIGANLMRGGDAAAGVEFLTGALRQRWYDPSRDATPVPLLESVLEAMREQGHSDEHCVAMLVPLVRAGFSADYLVQLRYLDRALAALSSLCGVTLAHKLRPYLGKKLGLFIALAYAALRFAFIPRTRRLASFKEAMIALFTTATAGTAAAVSAFDPEKARDILAKLAPLEGFPEGTAPQVSYQFALASYEVGSGQAAAAAARYAKLLARLNRGPVPDLDEDAHRIFRLGCLYGQAQAEISKNSPLALTLADELQGGHPFYAPHAESTRMAYYVLRGEQEQADLYRERAELAALRGGMSWSSVTVLTIRCLYAYIWWRNPMGLTQLIPELTRLARTAPNLALYGDLAQANLALMRGQSQEAVRLFEQVLHDPRHRALPTFWQDRTFYAQALCAVGRYEEAAQICGDLLLHDESYRNDVARQIPVQQLALAEAGLGKLDAAAARIDRCIAEQDPLAHDLLRGSLHRDRARIALTAHDDSKFHEHLRAMSEHYAATKNPWLMRQCEQLAAEAQLGAARAQSLLAPARGGDGLTTESVTFITGRVGTN